jgi:NADPH:quinone reductase-like Zn-dependent oxidoreductase
MKAAILAEYGNGLEVADIDRPDLPDDSAMVEVHAAPINTTDWFVMDGQMKDMLPYPLPWTVGYDVSGVVVGVGPEARGFSVGDGVFARADGMQAGTMADYSAVKASDLAIKPSDISHAEAAGTPLAGLTACKRCSTEADSSLANAYWFTPARAVSAPWPSSSPSTLVRGSLRLPALRTRASTRTWVQINSSTTQTSGSKTSSNRATS